MDQLKKRILHTEASDGWGGQEMRILGEAAGMRARGYDVQVAAPQKAQILVEAKRYGVPTHVLPLNRRNPLSVAAVLQLWSKLKPDVVITHSSADTWLVTIAARLSRSRPGIIRMRHLSMRVAKGPLNRWLYGAALDRLITTGAATRLTLINDLRLDPRSVVSIPTGTDISRFVPGDKKKARATLGLPADTPIIGIVAALRSWKGHRFLISALQDSRLAKATLVIVGDGEDRARLEAQAAKEGVSDRIIFAGRRDDIPMWLAAFDVFALPSTGNEATPQSIQQAMACSIPVVTTPAGASIELVIDGKTGLIAESENVKSIADAITRVLGDPALAKRLSKAGQKHVHAKYTNAVMLDAMEKVIAEVTGKNQGKQTEKRPA